MSDEALAHAPGEIRYFSRNMLPPGGLRFVYGGRFLAVMGWRGIELWNARTAQKAYEIELPDGFRYGGAWAVDRSSRTIVWADRAGDLRLLELPGGELRRIGFPDAARAYFGFESPGLASFGGVEYSDGSYEDRSVRIPPYRAVSSVALSPSGLAVVAYGQAFALVWDLRTGRLVRHLGGDDSAGPPCRIHRVAWSPDGRAVLTSDTWRELRLWDARTGRERLALELGEDPYAGAADRPLDMPAQVGSFAGLGAIAFTPDSKQIVAGDGAVARRWDVETGCELEPWIGHCPGHVILGQQPDIPRIRDIRFSADGRWALTVGMDATLLFWDVASGREIWRMTPAVCCVDWGDISPDGRYVAWAGCPGMRVYEVP